MLTDPLRLMVTIFSAHPTEPGKNQGDINNYVFDTTSVSFTSACLLYYNFVNQTVRSLYPDPTGAFRDALNFGLNIFYGPLEDRNCMHVFPFGQ